MDSIDIIRNHCEFNHGEVYILSVMARKKNNEEFTQSTQRIRRKIISNDKELLEGYEYLKEYAMNDSEHLYYMYVSVNPRNVKKALTVHANMVINLIAKFDEDVGAFNTSKRLSGKWFSALENDSCRGRTRYYMIDLDDKTLLDAVVNYLETYTEIKRIQETKNGYHIIVNPMNVKQFREDFAEINKEEKLVEIKKDALTFIEAINE